MTLARKEVRGERRCTGHCCENLFSHKHGARWLGVLVQYVRGSYWAHSTEPGKHSLKAIGRSLREYATVLRMLIPRGGGGFACRHFDTKTRNCTIYERRPWMCKAYPYGKPCTRPGCTLEV